MGSLEAQDQAVEHQPRALPKVVAVLKLRELLRKMLSADMDMRASDGAFQMCPEAFQSVHMGIAVHPFVAPLVDGAVPVAVAGQFGVAAQFVAADLRTGLDLLQNDALQR